GIGRGSGHQPRQRRKQLLPELSRPAVTHTAAVAYGVVSCRPLLALAPPPRALLALAPPPRALLALAPPPRALLAPAPPPRALLAVAPPPRPIASPGPYSPTTPSPCRSTTTIPAGSRSRCSPAKWSPPGTPRRTCPGWCSCRAGPGSAAPARPAGPPGS